jgi:hypothetical protein
MCLLTLLALQNQFGEMIHSSRSRRRVRQKHPCTKSRWIRDRVIKYARVSRFWRCPMPVTNGSSLFYTHHQRNLCSLASLACSLTATTSTQDKGTKADRDEKKHLL